jgi:hypothetical protein
VEHKGNYISGRPSVTSSKSRSVKGSDSRDYPVLEMSGLDCKLGEESLGAQQRVDLFRMGVELFKNGNKDERGEEIESFRLSETRTEDVHHGTDGNDKVARETHWDIKRVKDSVPTGKPVPNEASQGVDQGNAKKRLERNGEVRPVSDCRVTEMDRMDPEESVAIARTCSSSSGNLDNGCSAIRLGGQPSCIEPQIQWTECLRHQAVF